MHHFLTEVVLALLNQPAQVRFFAFPNFFKFDISVIEWQKEQSNESLKVILNPSSIGESSAAKTLNFDQSEQSRELSEDLGLVKISASKLKKVL